MYPVLSLFEPRYFQSGARCEESQGALFSVPGDVLRSRRTVRGDISKHRTRRLGWFPVPYTIKSYSVSSPQYGGATDDR